MPITLTWSCIRSRRTKNTIKGIANDKLSAEQDAREEGDPNDDSWAERLFCHDSKQESCSEWNADNGDIKQKHAPSGERSEHKPCA